MVVLATLKREHGTELLVVPVTTRPPRPGDAAVEIPARVRQHLSLGEERAWIVVDEINRFTWPGPDIRPIRRGDEITPRYGSVPGKLLEQVRREMEKAIAAGKLKMTKRTE